MTNAMETRSRQVVALISGGAGAIGSAVGRRLAAGGASVVLAGLRADEGAAIAREIGAQAISIGLDVRDPDAWAHAVAAANDRFGPVTVLVNNAGTTSVQAVEAISFRHLEEVTAVNQYGVLFGMQSVFGGMCAAGGGSIVNVSSISAGFGVGFNAAYAGAKAATHAYGKAAAVEWARHNIRVNTVVLGAIDTPMANGGAYRALGNLSERVAAQVPLARAGSVDEVAGLVAYLTAPDGAYCTGAEFVVDGGWTAGRLRRLEG